MLRDTRHAASCAFIYNLTYWSLKIPSTLIHNVQCSTLVDLAAIWATSRLVAADEQGERERQLELETGQLTCISGLTPAGNAKFTLCGLYCYQ